MPGSDPELWPYENFDTMQMLLMFKSEVEKIAFVEDPCLPPMSEAQRQQHEEMESRLSQSLSVERLERIQSNIKGLDEKDLQTQAVRLELAVHKLSNRGFDKVAEEFCEQYGLYDGDNSQSEEPLQPPHQQENEAMQDQTGEER